MGALEIFSLAEHDGLADTAGSGENSEQAWGTGSDLQTVGELV